MTDRGDAPDGETGRRPDEVRVGSLDGPDREDRGDLGGVDLVIAAGEDEHGGSVRSEHQGLHDRADRDAKGGCCLGRGARRVVELADLTRCSAGLHSLGVRVHERTVTHPVLMLDLRAVRTYVRNMTTLLEAPIEKPRSATPASALRLALAARRALGEAEQAGDSGERYAAAHLSALRAAAAVLAAQARPESGRSLRRGRPTSVWTLLVRIAPELSEWAEFFAAGADKRIAAQAGLRGAATAREADDLVRDAGQFLDLVAARLGLPPARQPMLPLGTSSIYPANGPTH